MRKYLNLLQDIKDNGEWKNPAREGMPRTKSIFSRSLRFDLQEGFPAVTTKKLYWKGVVGELIWFLRKKVSIDYLHENNIHIWDGDCYKWDKESKSLLGKIYPHQWRNWGSNILEAYADKTPFSIKLNEININNYEIFHSNNYGDFIVIDKLKDYKSEIQFINTGYITTVRTDKVKSGEVSDPYYPTIRNICCSGIWDKSLNINKELYILWKGVVDRCYNIENDNYKYYGEKGVRLSNRWKCFEFFLEDVENIPNWDLKNNNWNDYNLDKDIIGNGLLYSLSTCIWSNKSDNTKKSKEKNIYIITNGTINEEFINPVDIINKYNLHQGNFCSMLRGERNICQGWTLVSSNKIDNGFDQIEYLIKNIKKNPNSRYHKVTAWNPTDFLQNPENAALPACHTDFQVYIREGKYLDLDFNCRSQDVFLGTPFNIASYALLIHILADLTGYYVGELIWNGKDIHYYENHQEQVDEILTREPYELPILFKEDNYLNTLYQYRIDNDLDKFLNSIQIEDFKLYNYKSYEALKAPLSVGI